MTTPVEDFPTSEKNPDPSSSFKSPPSLSQPSPDDKSIVTTDLQSRLSNPAPPVESLAFVNMNSNERFHLPELTRINFLDWEGKVISVLRLKDLYDLVLDKEEKHRDEKGQFVAKEKDPIPFGAAKKKANSFKAWYKLNHLELRTNNIAEFTSEYWNCIATLQSLDKVIEPASLGHALLAKIPASLSHVRDAIIAAGSSSELVVSHETVLDLLDSQLSAVIPDARPQTTSSLPRQSDPSEASALLTQKCPQGRHLPSATHTADNCFSIHPEKLIDFRKAMKAKQEAEAHLAMFVPPSTYNVEATQCQDNNDIDLVNSFQALSSKFTKDDSDDHQSEAFNEYTYLLTCPVPLPAINVDARINVRAVKYLVFSFSCTGIADSSVIICVSLSTKVEGKLDRDGLTYLLSLTGKKISWPFCWNSIPNSNSRKRKISSSLNPEPQTSKRPASLPSDFPLDHQRSRSSNDNHLSSKDKDFNLSQSNKTIKSNLLDRITSTSQDLNHSV
ncbi:hypothetical protein MJO29_008472 [Puccinia striiformis f. sp. tritici]|nr:hypothetical protein MJO29_008472 [Puccinia striiformis f. sp. tritici]